MAALVPRLAYSAALICALPTHAQDVAAWDGTGCVLIPVDGAAHVAEINCLNVETTGDAFTEGNMTAGGLTVGLAVSHGPGAVQDVFTFAAPDGYVVVPPVLSLDEFTSGSAVVVVWLGY